MTIPQLRPKDPVAAAYLHRVRSLEERKTILSQQFGALSKSEIEIAIAKATELDSAVKKLTEEYRSGNLEVLENATELLKLAAPDLDDKAYKMATGHLEFLASVARREQDLVSSAYQLRGEPDSNKRYARLSGKFPDLSSSQINAAIKSADALNDVVYSTHSISHMDQRAGMEAALRIVEKAVPGLTKEAYETAATTIHYHNFRDKFGSFSSGSEEDNNE